MELPRRGAVLFLRYTPMGCGASTAKPDAGTGSKNARADKWTANKGTRTTMYFRSELPDDLKDFELRPKAEEIFILADRDGDGKLSMSELRDIMHRPEMTDQVMSNYTSAETRQRETVLKQLTDANDERVTLEEFLAQVKKSYDTSKRVAEKMLFIYERELRNRQEAEEAAAAAPAAADGDEEAATAPEEVAAAPAVEAPPPVLRNEFGK